VSGKSPYILALDAGSYLLRETVAPAGYAVTTDIPFTVNPDMSVSGTTDAVEGANITLRDNALYVKIAKVDENGSVVAGATLTLTDETTGELVEQWVSDKDVHTITRAGSTGVALVGGHTYVLHEVAAPAGYQLAEDLRFVFNGDGTIPNCPYRLVSMVDKLEVAPLPDNQAPSEEQAPTKNEVTVGDPGTGGDPAGGDGGAVNGATTVDPSAGNGTGNGTTGTGGKTILRTGDSPVMWIFLALAVICIGGAATLFVVAYLQKKKKK
ncbi:MAG: SpaA isopeptide-forming pilin-related protein, partial [Gemmiger sp.]|nr:SpaA isopeptide-forming pilin-related protein [Gemmiger sp.]